jgi:hypothetical protein
MDRGLDGVGQMELSRPRMGAAETSRPAGKRTRAAYMLGARAQHSLGEERGQGGLASTGV